MVPWLGRPHHAPDVRDGAADPQRVSAPSRSPCASQKATDPPPTRSIHIILALQEFVQGTGLARFNFRRVLQRLCLLPQDCPHCGNDLHADGAEAPLLAAAPPSWFRGMGGSGGRIKLPVSGVPGGVGWSAPPWMGRRGSEVVGEGQETGVEDRHRDDGGVSAQDAGVGGKGKGVAGEGEGEGV